MLHSARGRVLVLPDWCFQGYLIPWFYGTGNPTPVNRHTPSSHKLRMGVENAITYPIHTIFRQCHKTSCYEVCRTCTVYSILIHWYQDGPFLCYFPNMQVSHGIFCSKILLALLSSQTWNDLWKCVVLHQEISQRPEDQELDLWWIVPHPEQESDSLGSNSATLISVCGICWRTRVCTFHWLQYGSSQ